jgi:patatin-like phospholipase/acyl hydrolase
VPTYDVVHRQAVVLKSHTAAYRHLSLWSVAKASASAPTYFPAQEIVTAEAGSPTGTLVSKRRALIDGGIVANNPAACAVAEALRLNREQGHGDSVEGLVVVSIGTGRPPGGVSAGDAKAWGISQWATSIIGVLMSGADEATDYVVRQLLTRGATYIRVQIDIPEHLSSLDDASSQNITALKRRAIEALDDGPVREALRMAVEALRQSRAA